MPVPTPASFIDEMRAQLVATPDPADMPALPDDIVKWLAQLILLYGLPLEYLVPNPALLPTESLRFFYLDANWQRRLIDGALSIGLSSSLDALAALAIYENAVLQSRYATAGVRAELRGKAPPTVQADPPGPITGFLLHSAVVSDWPGMEVSAYADPNAPPLKLLRLDRVTADIMLGLVEGVPSEVRFLQPPEGLHFGVIPSGSASTVYLRGLGYGGFQPGIQLQPTASATLAARAGGKGVLDIAGSMAALEAALQAAGAWGSGDPFTAAEFAIQMTRGAGLQIFQWSDTGVRDE